MSLGRYITPEQFAKWQEQLGLDNAELAKKLGVTRSTVWKRKQPGARSSQEVGHAMRWLLYQAGKID